MASRFKFLVLMPLLIQKFGLAVAGSIAAWLTGLGAPQIIMQDDATGKILYSLCNSNGSTPIFPGNVSASFEFDSIYTPKNDTSLTGTGWVDDDVNVAAIWFQREDGKLVFQLWKCNGSGHFNLYSSFSQRTIGAGQSIHPRTALMSLNLGDTAGYRVYYQDERKETSTLAYSETTDVWDTQGRVSGDSIKGIAISAGFMDINNITVVTPRDESNIEISTQQRDGTWVIATLPTPLEEVYSLSGEGMDATIILSAPTNNTSPASFHLDPNATVDWSLDAWDGNAGGIGLTFDDNSTRSIYYIGNDSFLHCLTEVGGGGWRKSPRQDEKAWPRADVPNSQFATTYDFHRNEVFIYYVSGGHIYQIHRSAKYTWDPATPLARYNSTVLEEPESNKGLPAGTKAGIGVGASVGGLVLLLLTIYVVIWRRRNRKDKQVESEARPPVPATENKSPPPQPIYYEMPTQEHSHEAPSSHGYREMPDQQQAHEVSTSNDHIEGVSSTPD